MKVVILIGLVVIFSASGLAELVRCLKQSEQPEQPLPYALTPHAERLFPGTDAGYFDGHTCVAGTPCSYEDNYLCSNARPAPHRYVRWDHCTDCYRLFEKTDIHDVIVATITDCEQWANGGAR